MKALVFSFFILFFICCNQHGQPTNKLSFKDSIVKQHLISVNTQEYYDTLNEDYRMLRAYINDDTGYFKQLQRNKQLYEEELKRYPPLDTCVHLQKLSSLDADEAYRFSHTQSFCYYHQKITITRKKDTVQLHYLEFSMPDDDGNVVKYIKDGKQIKVGPGCSIVKEFKKNLTMKDWNGLKEKLYNADYWGLKPDYYSSHTDGSSWQIETCKKNKWTSQVEQNYSVSRHCSCSPPFKELGTYFLSLSGEKTMCGEFF